MNVKAVWSKLAKAQLDAQLVSEAIHSYIKVPSLCILTVIGHREII